MTEGDQSALDDETVRQLVDTLQLLSTRVQSIDSKIDATRSELAAIDAINKLVNKFAPDGDAALRHEINLLRNEVASIGDRISSESNSTNANTQLGIVAQSNSSDGTPTARADEQDTSPSNGDPLPEDTRQQMSDMQVKMNRVENRLRIIAFWARLVPLFFIVAAIVSYPYVAILTDMNAADMTQYISPVTGLAGAVIGYWFGRAGPEGGKGD